MTLNQCHSKYPQGLAAGLSPFELVRPSISHFLTCSYAQVFLYKVCVTYNAIYKQPLIDKAQLNLNMSWEGHDSW